MWGPKEHTKVPKVGAMISPNHSTAPVSSYLINPGGLPLPSENSLQDVPFLGLLGRSLITRRFASSQRPIIGPEGGTLVGILFPTLGQQRLNFLMIPSLPYFIPSFLSGEKPTFLSFTLSLKTTIAAHHRPCHSVTKLFCCMLR
jgi:hypothetical protein